MTLRSTPVPMPPKKIVFKIATNGTTYVYFTLRANRNGHGNPTSDVVAIVKLEPTTGMVIPNQRYFELFRRSAHPDAQVSEVESQIPTSDVSRNRQTLPVRVACYGISYALHRMA
ncbi:MAG: hypothetical protein FWD57_09325, partial [Polyangiaceae bacterium]|nr:hypothetical protein [Polyangiaceae bacterium]